MHKFKSSIWFWQRMVTPHMAALASALADRGFKVNYVANEILSKKRIKQGWKMPKLGKVKLLLAPNKADVISYALEAPKNSIHLCQGLRGNGLVGNAQSIIRKRNLRHWAMMETIDDEGWAGYIKKGLYRILFLLWNRNLTGVLAIGHNASEWFVSRGMEKNRVYPFAYFLAEPKIESLSKLSNKKNKNKPYRFIYVGELINLKKVDTLIKAIAALKVKKIELWIVGSGPEEKRLRLLADLLIPKQVFWLGVISIKEVQNIIYQADCLVLPSRYDGWGAVVSEALMVGTPVVCSNKCGSSVIVKASGVGSVFFANNQKSLNDSLYNQYKKGYVNFKERQKIMKWAKRLTARSGAKYLELIFNIKNNKLDSPKIPWN